MDVEIIDHITLRPIEISDVDDFMVWATDENVSRFCTWDTYTSKPQAFEFINNIAIPHPWFRVICINNRAIGSISITPHSGIVMSCAWSSGRLSNGASQPASSYNQLCRCVWRYKPNDVLCSCCWIPGDPSNPTVKYFVTTTKEISASGFSKSSWKEDSQPIGIINEATGGGFKKCMKFQRDNSRWIIMEYLLNLNTPGVQEDLKNEVICRVRRIPINNPVGPTSTFRQYQRGNNRRKMKLTLTYN
ncbi:uncharacterized protein LOC132617285 isoform X1 [Lycium barbarum]|uniref:uncharacterized protein LOC132617285 isoform X1 n=1 Tax=Lycium barbarum TaxID=112863 RepID=UPI00293E36C9|nr:uncharacterized protein LOC132617285 isoform X1 [Lycium barbarum]